MHINSRIKRLERKANNKLKKHTIITVSIGEWRCDNGTCDKCKTKKDLPFKEYQKDGTLIINVGADLGYLE